MVKWFVYNEIGTITIKRRLAQRGLENGADRFVNSIFFISNLCIICTFRFELIDNKMVL